MPQLAITYAPNYSGTPGTGDTANTSQTGSFFVGQMGPHVWNQDVAQSTHTTFYIASPLTSSAYIFALPNPSGSTPSNPEFDQPHFFFSRETNGTPAITDSAFINTANFLLQQYNANGQYDPGNGVNPAGCSGTVGNCTTQLAAANFFHNYDFVPA